MGNDFSNMTYFTHYLSLLTVAGLSLKSQELTAIFLAVRLYCSLAMEHDIHTVLDFTTLVSTLWVIYMIRFKLKSSYIKELDNFPIYYVVKHVLLLYSQTLFTTK